MDFGVICVEVSRNFPKNGNFFKKLLLNWAENFESISAQVPSPPPPISLIHNRYIFGGRGEGTSVEILSKFSSCVEILFCQKWGFFENFRDTSTQITPKITFYCIFINKFHKNFEKSAQKFFAAPSVPKTCRNISIFYPWSEDGTTPLEGSPPK